MQKEVAYDADAVKFFKWSWTNFDQVRIEKKGSTKLLLVGY